MVSPWGTLPEGNRADSQFAVAYLLCSDTNKSHTALTTTLPKPTLLKASPRLYKKACFRAIVLTKRDMEMAINI
jgi:hypothetical protein